LFLAPLAGIGIAEAVRFVVRRRRSRNLPAWVATATFIGGIFLTLFNVLVIFITYGKFGLNNLLSILWPVVYAIMATSAVFYRLKGIKL
jgi:hypothetical protein